MLLIRKLRTALFNEELRWYLGIVGFATVTIAYNLRSVYNSIAECFRYSFFQVASIISTTGYSTADFDKWRIQQNDADPCNVYRCVRRKHGRRIKGVESYNFA